MLTHSWLHRGCVLMTRLPLSLAKQASLHLVLHHLFLCFVLWKHKITCAYRGCRITSTDSWAEAAPGVAETCAPRSTCALCLLVLRPWDPLLPVPSSLLWWGVFLWFISLYQSPVTFRVAQPSFYLLTFFRWMHCFWTCVWMAVCAGMESSCPLFSLGSPIWKHCSTGNMHFQHSSGFQNRSW